MLVEMAGLQYMLRDMAACTFSSSSQMALLFSSAVAVVLAEDEMDVTMVDVVRPGSNKTSAGETISIKAAKCRSSSACDDRIVEASVKARRANSRREGREGSTGIAKK